MLMPKDMGCSSMFAHRALFQNMRKSRAEYTYPTQKLYLLLRPARNTQVSPAIDVMRSISSTGVSPLKVKRV